MIDRLTAYLQNLTTKGIALAYSGGVDSTLLLAVLANMHQKEAFAFEALTMQTVLQDKQEMTEAEKTAAAFGVRQKIFTFNPFSEEAVRHNRPDRCYCCKKAIFTRFSTYARSKNLTHILDGTNADDLNVYRPGRKALTELGVISPLAELGITKAEIRKMSEKLGLPTASKPASPCLATRFEYNTLLSDEAVYRVAAGEDAIRKNFPDCGDIRLRVHDKTARLELPKDKLSFAAAQAELLVSELKKLGFEYITLDLEGFRSGSFDRNFKQT